MRILEIHKFHRAGGGADKAFLDNIKLFEGKGHEVIVFSMQHPDNLPSRFEPYFPSNRDYRSEDPLHRLSAAMSSIWSGEAYEKISRLVKEYRPDIAHVHNFLYQLTPSILYALKKHRIPIVNTLHDYYPLCPGYRLFDESGGRTCEDCRGHRYYYALKNRCMKRSAGISFLGMVNGYYHHYRKSYRLIDRFISPGEFLKEKMVRHGYDAGKIAVIRNFVDPGEEPSYRNGSHILYAGVFLKEKGVDDLIRAFKLLDGAVSLHIAGDGPYREALRQEAVGDDRIKFLGFLDQTALMQVMENAAAVVVPSTCYENFPYAVLEACCRGKVVMGSRIGGIPEIITEDETGYLFEPGNYEDLARRLEKILSLSENEKAAMGKRARERVRTLCGREAYYKAVMQIFTTVPGSGKGQGV